MKHLVIWRELVFKISNLSKKYYLTGVTGPPFTACFPKTTAFSQTSWPKSQFLTHNKSAMKPFDWKWLPFPLFGKFPQVVPKLVILVHITGRTMLTPSQITCARKSPGKSTKKAKEGAQKEKYTRWRPQQAWISGHRCVLKKVLKTSNLSKGSHIEIISGGVVVFVFVLQTGRQAIYLAFLF